MEISAVELLLPAVQGPIQAEDPGVDDVAAHKHLKEKLGLSYYSASTWLKSGLQTKKICRKVTLLRSICIDQPGNPSVEFRNGVFKFRISVPNIR